MIAATGCANKKITLGIGCAGDCGAITGMILKAACKSYAE